MHIELTLIGQTGLDKYVSISRGMFDVRLLMQFEQNKSFWDIRHKKTPGYERVLCPNLTGNQTGFKLNL